MTLVLAGCLDPGDDETTTATDAGPVYTETIVHVAENGQILIDERPLTVAREQAENAVKARIAAGEPVPFAQDPGCAPTSFWLYDQPNHAGNRICFGSYSNAYLGDYQRPIRLGSVFIGWGDWKLARGSYWAGSDWATLLMYGSTRFQVNPYNSGNFDFGSTNYIANLLTAPFPF